MPFEELFQKVMDGPWRTPRRWPRFEDQGAFESVREGAELGKTILIVEDEQNIVDILSFNLSGGYDTLEAMTGIPAPAGSGTEPGPDPAGPDAAGDERI